VGNAVRGPESAVDIVAEDEPGQVIEDVEVSDVGAADGVLAELAAALASADDLPLDERLELLRRAEGEISRSLEGLDGL
jgi:hypothetical protein